MEVSFKLHSWIITCLLYTSFSADTQAEVNAILQWCKENGHRVVLSDAWASGGAGAVDLAQEVVRMCEEDSKFEPLYDLDLSLEEKIDTIVRKIYGGRSVIFSDRAKAQLEEYKRAGWDLSLIHI